MAVSYIGTGAVSSTDPANPTCNADDLLLFGCVGDSATLSLPAGWNAIINNQEFAAGSAEGHISNWWWKRAVGGDSGATVTITNGGTHTARIMNLRSDAAFDWVTPVVSSHNEGAGTTVTANAVTTTSANTTVVVGYSTDANNSSATVFTNANLGSITNRWNNGGTGVTRSLKVDTGTFVGPGTTGNSTKSVTSSNWIGFHIAAKEAAATVMPPGPLIVMQAVQRASSW